MLGIEAEKVLDEMKREGMPEQPLNIFYELARKAAWLESKISKNVEEKKARIYNWWNRGFCRENEILSFVHEIEDCTDHLKGDCTNRG